MFDINTFKDLALAALPLAGLVTGLTEVTKMTFAIEDRFVPFTAIIIGMAIGLLLIELSALGAIVGISLGLASVGVWEFGKTTILNQSTKEKLANIED